MSSRQRSALCWRTRRSRSRAIALRFRFMLSPGHSMAVHAGQMFDLMITVPVRYKGLFTETHIFMYCSDPMGICAGREVFGYTKKDTDYAFDETCRRLDYRMGQAARDSAGGFQFHARHGRADRSHRRWRGAACRRNSRAPPAASERLETAYADIAYRRTPLKYSAPLPGVAP